MEITEIGLLAVKIESAYGTDSTPTGVNAIPTVGDSLTYNVKSSPVARKAMDGTHDRLPGYNGQAQVELKFQYELRGNRTDGTAADISSGSSAHAIEIDALLQAAHFAAAYTAESAPGVRNGQVVYTPTIYLTNVGPSVTCYWWSGLKLHKLTGGKVDVKVIMEAGKIPIAEFTVSGLYTAPTDAALITPTFVLTKPQLMEGAQVAIGGQLHAVTKLEFSIGNRIGVRKSIAATNGIFGTVITGYDAKGTMDPESNTEAAASYWANWKGGVSTSIVAGTPFVTGNTLGILCAAEFKKINYADRENMRVHNIEFNLPKADLKQPTSSAAFSFTFA